MTQPNILIFMTDHQRGDTVLPEHPAITPNLDAFAKEGVTFTETYCPAPHCCPARATFHSGLYPSRSGIWNNVLNEQALSYSLNKGVRLWSEDLAEAGYDLQWLGKWHVCADEFPRDRGWTEIHASSVPGDRNGPTWDDYKKLAQNPDDMQRGEGQILRPGYGKTTIYGTKDEGKDFDNDMTVKAVKVLPELGKDQKPWALFVGVQGPHDPYNVPQQFLDLYDIDAVPLPPNFADELSDKPRVYRKMRDKAWGQFTEREVREAIRHFWAYCSYLDHLFGKILNELEKGGQADNTLVLYCSDHGDYCGEHGLFAKGIPSFRGAYHVPAVVRWPAGIKTPGKRVDEFVSLADFAPTFLDLAGISTDREFSGRSLMPFLRGETPDDWRKEMFFQCNGVELYFTQRIIMTKEYKYVYNGFDFDELYDLKSDPHELKNLAHDPSYEDIKRHLCGKMWQCAYNEHDAAPSRYITVGLAPYGPGEAFSVEG